MAWIRAAVIALTAVAAHAAVQLNRGAGSGADVLRHLTSMQPEVVARLLTQVEHHWETSALSDLQKKSDPKASLKAMQDSCGKVTHAIIEGSEGDKDRVATYLRDVCANAYVGDQARCGSFASALNIHLSNDAYTNREDMNIDGFCESFYDGAVAAAAKKQAEADHKAEESAEQAKAGQMAEAASRQLDLAKAALGGAQAHFAVVSKEVDALGDKSLEVTKIADRARSAIRLADEKEADAAEAEAKAAAEKAAKLREEKARVAEMAEKDKLKKEAAKKAALIRRLSRSTVTKGKVEAKAAQKTASREELDTLNLYLQQRTKLDSDRAYKSTLAKLGAQLTKRTELDSLNLELQQRTKSDSERAYKKALAKLEVQLTKRTELDSLNLELQQRTEQDEEAQAAKARAKPAAKAEKTAAKATHQKQEAKAANRIEIKAERRVVTKAAKAAQKKQKPEARAAKP